MITILGIIAPIALQLIGWWVGAGKNASKEQKAMWENFQIFIKSVDAYRSKKVYESSKKQRDRLKDV